MPDPIVLCYHAIGESWQAAVSADRLRQHVRNLLGRGYEPKTFVDAVSAAPGAKTFSVTFDDAYASVLDRALPVLADLGVPGTVFVVTGFADGGAALEWDGLLESGVGDPEARRSLTWAQMGHLAAEGWEVGSHTCTHPHLTRLDDEALARELRGSKETCERALNRECRSIAYPYGDLDERVVAAAVTAGYEAACSLSVATSGRHAWPRIGVYAVDSLARFRLKTSPTVLRVRRALADRGAQAR